MKGRCTNGNRILLESGRKHVRYKPKHCYTSAPHPLDITPFPCNQKPPRWLLQSLSSQAHFLIYPATGNALPIWISLGEHRGSVELAGSSTLNQNPVLPVSHITVLTVAMVSFHFSQLCNFFPPQLGHELPGHRHYTWFISQCPQCPLST